MKKQQTVQEKKVISTKEGLPKWQVFKVITSDGERYTLQRLHTDALKPYYLTERVYRFESTARRALEGTLKYGSVQIWERKQKQS